MVTSLWEPGRKRRRWELVLGRGGGGLGPAGTAGSGWGPDSRRSLAFGRTFTSTSRSTSTLPTSTSARRCSGRSATWSTGTGPVAKTPTAATSTMGKLTSHRWGRLLRLPVGCHGGVWVTPRPGSAVGRGGEQQGTGWGERPGGQGQWALGLAQHWVGNRSRAGTVLLDWGQWGGHWSNTGVRLGLSLQEGP